jgi:hypothetical protein
MQFPTMRVITMKKSDYSGMSILAQTDSFEAGNKLGAMESECLLLISPTRGTTDLKITDSLTSW